MTHPPFFFFLAHFTIKDNVTAVDKENSKTKAAVEFISLSSL